MQAFAADIEFTSGEIQRVENPGFINAGPKDVHRRGAVTASSQTWPGRGNCPPGYVYMKFTPRAQPGQPDYVKYRVDIRFQKDGRSKFYSYLDSQGYKRDGLLPDSQAFICSDPQSEIEISYTVNPLTGPVKVIHSVVDQWRGLVRCAATLTQQGYTNTNCKFGTGKEDMGYRMDYDIYFRTVKP